MNPSFAIAGRIRQLNDRGDLPIVELSNAHGRALVCLQGAQVIEYQPHNQPPVLWLSDKSRFENGQAIRGGIPICWPWFGDHPQDPALPAHGFARTSRWKVLASAADSETSSLRLGLKDDDCSRQLWPYKFELELSIQLGRQLSLTLCSHNTNDRPMPITEALHSYLAVSNIDQTFVTGLEGCCYRDKLDQLNPYIQDGPLTIAEETDRVYVDTEGTVTLNDPGFGRHILISKDQNEHHPDANNSSDNKPMNHNQSRSTVIWNPGAEKSLSMSDVDDNGYQRLLCVETANALDNALEIPPGHSHSMSTQIESTPSETAPSAALSTTIFSTTTLSTTTKGSSE
ncbi:MAG: D-hexose-6-phosphate mutarotase [Motiliproteus sp.]